MSIVIIGHTGHGKTTLIQAIKIINGKQCVEMNTVNLVEVWKEEKEKLDKVIETISEKQIDEMFDVEPISNNNRRKKGKELKNWQRTKFYQG